MHLFIVFLLVLAVASPGEMKTVEELEEELEVLKIKFENVVESMEIIKGRTENIETKAEMIGVKTENIETKTEMISAKTEMIGTKTEMIGTKTEMIGTKTEMMGKSQNDTEERLQYLEEMIKLNTIRTCQEMAQFGITASNYYHIDPDGPLVGHEPIRVWCEFSDDGKAFTEILHNSENKIDVEKCDEPGCYTHPVVYTAPQQQIQALKSLSMECEQSVRYDCVMAPLMVNNINVGYWNDPADNSHIYWTGSHQGDHVCSCFYEEDGCLEQSIKETRCNCDASVPEPVFDMGVIRNKTALPISSLNFGGLTYDLQQASHTLGRLRCWGKAGYEEGTSCAAIKRSGQFYNGLYNIKRSQEYSELVFCNLTGASGYEQDQQNEIFIESSETHFELVEKSIANIDTEIADIDQGIATINTDINKLEDDVSRHNMKSSFCAYHDGGWSQDYSMITYDKLLTEDNNVAGSSLHISTGLFTAGVGGTYRLDVGIGWMTSTHGDYNQVNMQLNGVNMDEGSLHSRISGTTYSYQGAGRSLIVRLEKNDVVGVYAGLVNELYYITFCVDLDTVAT